MRLSTINTLLIVCIIVVNGFVIVTPFIPSLLYAHDRRSGKVEQLAAQLQPATMTSDQSAQPNQPNRLIAPGMLLEGGILEGADTYAVLNKGILRWQASSTPDKPGNTVLLAHRFTYTNPRGAFYNLDKLAAGDIIGVVWNNKTYRYSVTSSATVSPDRTDILQNSGDDRLTLFTCTPLWSPKDRLVVTAMKVAS